MLTSFFSVLLPQSPQCLWGTLQTNYIPRFFSLGSAPRTTQTKTGLGLLGCVDWKQKAVWGGTLAWRQQKCGSERSRLCGSMRPLRDKKIKVPPPQKKRERKKIEVTRETEETALCPRTTVPFPCAERFPPGPKALTTAKVYSTVCNTNSWWEVNSTRKRKKKVSSVCRTYIIVV